MIQIPRNKRMDAIPDWATEGKKVAVVSRSAHGHQTLSFYPVTRTTSTQVILGDTRYNIKTGLEQMGWGGNVYTSVPFLADPALPEVQLKKLESAERMARHRIKIIADTFDKKGDEDTAMRIEEALEEWRKADIALDDFRDEYEAAKDKK